jgi:hypothetical protein
MGHQIRPSRKLEKEKKKRKRGQGPVDGLSRPVGPVSPLHFFSCFLIFFHNFCFRPSNGSK